MHTQRKVTCTHAAPLSTSGDCLGMKHTERVCLGGVVCATESSCAQIEAFQQKDSRLLYCDPVKNKASVLLGLTHAGKPSHTPSDTIKVHGKGPEHGSSKGHTCLVERVEQEKPSSMIRHFNCCCFY